MNESTNRLAAIWADLTTSCEFAPFVTEEDRKVFFSRVEREGLPYLTEVLPAEGKRLEHFLSRTTSICSLEAWTPVEGMTSPIPSFLSLAWTAVFREDDGVFWLDRDGWKAVQCIRQLTLMFYKLQLPFKTESVERTCHAWLKAEQDLAALPDELFDPEKDLLLRRARGLVCRLLANADPTDVVPKHGSGSSSCRVVPWERWESFRYVDRLASVFPYDSYFYLANGCHLVDEVHKLHQSEYVIDRHGVGIIPDRGSFPTYNRRDPQAPSASISSMRQVGAMQPNGNYQLIPVKHYWEDEVLYSKVVFVHKDSRGPRLISTEPRELMYIQQGLRAKLYAEMRRLPGIAASLDCEDQERNRIRAYAASVTGCYATLDLKEASDRVDVRLVKALFPANWTRALLASRSQYTRFPDSSGVPAEMRGSRVTFRLAKYAPMGNATTFPVEALCFWALSVAALGDDNEERKLFSRRFTSQDLLKVNKGETLWKPQVLVFGDDIIVPTTKVERIIQVLERYGLVVNRSKSFERGPFRESCGADYYNGRNVAVVKVKHLPDNDKYSAHRCADVINNLVAAYGYHHLGPCLKARFNEWYGPVVVSKDYVLDRRRKVAKKHHAFLSLYGPSTEVDPPIRTRYNRALQRREVLAECERGVDVTVRTDRWSQVMRTLATISGSIDGSSRAGVCTLAKRTRYNLAWSPLA